MTTTAAYKLIAAERAYEYVMDEIRLTILSAPTIRGRIREVFEFESVEIARPPTTFGTVVRTSPPGIVFSLGEIVTSQGDFVVVRSLHIEPTRIVVSVLNDTEFADSVFELLRETVVELGLADSDALLPDPRAVVDRSEFSLRTKRDGHALERLLNPDYVSLLKRHFLGSAASDALIVSTFDTFVASTSTDDEDERAGAFEIGPRYGTEVSEGTVRSVAPLATEPHRLFLDDMIEFFESISCR